METQAVLIISEDAEFSRAIVGRWQAERSVPVFTLMGGDVRTALDPESFGIAIIGRVRPGQLVPLDALLATAGRPAVLVASDAATARLVREQHPRMLVVHEYEGWQETVVLLGCEILRRVQADLRAQRAESLATAGDRNATLGRFMLEMRHNLNNALTSVLGNSELMLLDPATLTPVQRAQVETIRNMAVRVHEVMLRFSSLDTELKCMERQRESERSEHRSEQRPEHVRAMAAN